MVILSNHGPGKQGVCALGEVRAYSHRSCAEWNVFFLLRKRFLRSLLFHVSEPILSRVSP